jgi:hypothetical protein
MPVPLDLALGRVRLGRSSPERGPLMLASPAWPPSPRRAVRGETVRLGALPAAVKSS